MKQQTVTKSEFRRKHSVHPNIIAFTQPSVVVSVANTKQTEASTKWLSAATINNVLCTMDTCYFPSYFLYGFRFHTFVEHLFHMHICIAMRRDHTNTHIWRHLCRILYRIQDNGLLSNSFSFFPFVILLWRSNLMMTSIMLEINTIINPNFQTTKKARL